MKKNGLHRTTQKLRTIVILIGIVIFATACGVLSTTINDDALPGSKRQFYTVVVASRNTTHRRKNAEGVWQIEKNYPVDIDIRQEQGFAKCIGSAIAKESPLTTFLHEKWLYQAVPNLDPEKRYNGQHGPYELLSEEWADKAKEIGLRFILVLDVAGSYDKDGWLSSSDGVTHIALPTIIGYEHGVRSCSIKASVYDLAIRNKTIINAEISKPYYVTGLVLFPIWDIPDVETEACEQAGRAIGQLIQKAVRNQN